MTREKRDRDSLVALEVPWDSFKMAARRIHPFVRHYAAAAQHGQLDLTGLAASAYLQGVLDGVELLRTRPELLPELLAL